MNRNEPKNPLPDDQDDEDLPITYTPIEEIADPELRKYLYRLDTDPEFRKRMEKKWLSGPDDITWLR